MRTSSGDHGEYPVVEMWYGKLAGSSIEKIIDLDPEYFIWIVKQFQDVTVQQADYFKDKYGMELPANVVAPPGTVPYQHKKDSPEKEYINLCKTYWRMQEAKGESNP